MVKCVSICSMRTVLECSNKECSKEIDEYAKEADAFARNLVLC